MTTNETTLTLQGVTSLHSVVTQRTFNFGCETEVKIFEEDYPLREVTPRELFLLRTSGKPGFVLKQEGKYYYTTIPKQLTFHSREISGEHMCSRNGKVCSRLSAAEDCNGGCGKVRDLDPLAYINNKKFHEAVRLSARIEKYPFIRSGYESFNTPTNSLVVLSCDNYQDEIREDPMFVSNLSPSY